jgi:alkaline phosphatase D
VRRVGLKRAKRHAEVEFEITSYFRIITMPTASDPARDHDHDHDYPARPSRRRALQAAAGLGALPLGAALPWVDAAPLAFAPAVFDVQADRALVWVSAHEALTAHVRWGLATDALTQKSAEQSFTAASGFTGHLALQGLPAGRAVHYRVFANDKPVSEMGRFNTPRVAGQSVVLAFSGDMEERYKPFQIFDTLTAAKPDFFMHLGDTVYADIPKRDFAPTLAHYRRKHATIRDDRPLQNFMAQCATFAIWDDHEIQNDAHGGLPQIAQAEQAFREYWPCQSVAKTGLYRAMLLAPEVELIILDTRRFRSLQAMDDGPEKTMLGAPQLAWFLDRLKRSTARFKIVATSVPFHGSSADAWGNYKTERDHVAAFIKHEQIANVVMITADYHFAREWSNKRTGIYEFMAGPLASFRTFDKSPSARERHSKGPHFVFGDDFNFGLLRYDGARKTLTVSYQDSAGKTLFEQILG